MLLSNYVCHPTTCCREQLVFFGVAGLADILTAFNPFRAPEPLPILNPSNFVPKNGFPVVKGVKRFYKGGEGNPSEIVWVGIVLVVVVVVVVFLGGGGGGL